MSDHKCSKCSVDLTNARSKYCANCRREKQLESARAYKRQNKERISEYNAKYKKEHNVEISKYNSQYDKDHRTEIQQRQTEYQRNRRQIDPAFKLAGGLRSKMYKFMNGIQSQTASNLLCCTKDDFVEWMKFQLKPGMTMENHGSLWHMDHVIPVARFDLTVPEEQQRCWHWSNFQPMNGSENMSKQDKVSADDIKIHLEKIKAFVEVYVNENNEKLTTLEYDRYVYVN